ncbi:hypothetical protein FO519_006317 [Halicephalobus sp. NKZ332]|nr:hypothetical protein FO519_006317 [Halicephalobus sp. NKZ332]
MSVDSFQMKRAVSDLIQKVLMVPPKHFTVKYAINPWMGGVVDQKKAQVQWDSLKSAIENQGVQVLVLDPVPDLPDMVFVCNSGIIFDKNVYLSRFKHKERTGEQEHYLNWFKSQNYSIHGKEYSNIFEGGGDACFSDYNTLWAGYGSRSNKDVYEKIKKLGNFEVVYCDLVNPKFYHLDTCFCPVGSKSALWYPPAFSESTQKEIKKRLPEAIEISDDEAQSFVCNAINVRNAVISPIGVSEKTKNSLSKLGYSVIEVDMSEFMKSGGASATYAHGSHKQLTREYTEEKPIVVRNYYDEQYCVPAKVVKRDDGLDVVILQAVSTNFLENNPSIVVPEIGTRYLMLGFSNIENRDNPFSLGCGSVTAILHDTARYVGSSGSSIGDSGAGVWNSVGQLIGMNIMVEHNPVKMDKSRDNQQKQYTHAIGGVCVFVPAGTIKAFASEYIPPAPPVQFEE